MKIKLKEIKNKLHCNEWKYWDNIEVSAAIFTT